MHNLCWTTNLFGFDIVYMETELFTWRQNCLHGDRIVS